MTRIIAGVAGGRRLRTPPGDRTRPTSERVREAVFARLEHFEVLDEATVLDLYAGSGALGLEAASRGAAAVVLVEKDRRTAAIIAGNARDLGLPGISVRAETVERVLATRPTQPFDVVFADPPYDVPDDTVAAVLEALAEHDWLAPEAMLVVERSTRSPEPLWPAGCELLGPRRYGETTVWFAQYVPEGDVA